MAVRLPSKFALPPGEIMIEKKDNKLILTPLDSKGWPVDMERWFNEDFGDLELPERPKDSRPISL